MNTSPNTTDVLAYVSLSSFRSMGEETAYVTIPKCQTFFQVKFAFHKHSMCYNLKEIMHQEKFHHYLLLEKVEFIC